MATDDEFEGLSKESASSLAVRRLEEIAQVSEGDPEVAHSVADDILCKLLRRLGHGEVADAYERVERWYA